MGQVGIPLFYLQQFSGMGFSFKDNFADGSQHWVWRKFLGELSEVGKHGSEQNGYYELSVEATKNGKWDTDDNEAPRLFISSFTAPCEIKTKLTYFLNNEDSCAGLFISRSPTGFGGDVHFGIVRKHTTTTDGIAVVKDAQTLASYINTTLPVWFRIRLGCVAYMALTAYFDYSYDGVNWTCLYTQATGWYQFPGHPVVGTGLYVNNFTSAVAVIGRFEFFKMKAKSPN